MHDSTGEAHRTSAPESFGVVVVDHGSVAAASNAMLLEIVAEFRRATGYTIVEPAHMELAEPSIAAAFDRCVEQGATRVVVFPYFLLPGRHSQEDIPQLAAEAAAKHPGVECRVAAPFGRHAGMFEIMQDRIRESLEN